MPMSRSRAKTEVAQGGRSGSKLTSTGSPQAANASELSARESETRDQLYFRAAALGINGRSRMTKAALRDAISRHEARQGASGP